MQQTLAQIKSWFETGDFPTQQQFWDTWDSFYHKSEYIPLARMDSSFNVVNNLSLITSEKSIVIAQLFNSQTLVPNNSIQSHMTIIIQNMSANPIQIPIAPLSGWVNWDGDIELQLGGIAELNILKADMNYIMHRTFTPAANP